MWIVDVEKCMVVHLWLRYSENWIDLDLDGSQDGKYGSYITYVVKVSNDWSWTYCEIGVSRKYGL